MDEIIWSEIARGIADAGEPLIRGEPDPGYSIVYPLLISPVYALFENLVDAYAGVKTLNSFVMSLAAVPAFFLARRVVRDGLALLAAAMTVAVPSMAYTGTVMTENPFYPLFLLVALVLVVALERPSPFVVVGLYALVGVAFATRVQAVALVPAILLAPLVLAVFQRRGFTATISRFRWLYGIAAGAVVAVLAIQLAFGSLLGAYSPVGEQSYDFAEVLRYLWWHVAELALYVLVIPLAATIVLVATARSLDARIQPFLAATVALTVCVVPVVAAFAAEFSDRIQERNMFYVAPLLCIALLAWIERGAPRPRLLASVAAVISAVLVTAIPLDRFITLSALTDTLMLLPFWSLQDRIGAEWIEVAAAGLAVGLAAAFLFVPRRFALALPLIVLALWTLAVRPIWSGKHGFERASIGALFQGIPTADRDWVDQALPSGAAAAFVWSGRTDRLTVNLNEFFNRGVGPVYYVTAPTPGGLPEREIRIDPETGAVTFPDGSPVRDTYVIADSSFEPAGEALATDKGRGVTLWRADSPLVSATRVDGLYLRDTWSGPEVTYTRRHCAPGRLSVDLSSDANLFLEPQTVVARSNGRVLGQVSFPPDERAVLTVPVAPLPGTTECRIVYTVSPTAVPAEVTPGGNPDPRRARRTLQPVRLSPEPMRIAFDVSPLSHPLLGIGNYIQGSLAGLAEAAAGTHEIVAFAPTSIRGPERIRAALTRDRRRGAHVAAPVLACPAHGLECRSPTCGRTAARRLRRAALLRLDVPAATGRRARDDDPRSRSPAPSGVDDPPHPGDARTQVSERRGDVRRRLRELGVHREGRRRDAGRARGAGSRRASRAEVGLPPRRPGGGLRLAVPPDRGDARAAQEPAGARRGASPTRRRPRARPRRRGGLGRAAAPRRSPDPATRLRLGRGARAALPWSSSGCLPVSVRGLRDPRDRGDGVWGPGRRLVARVARRGER